MDSSAIYVGASSSLLAERDFHAAASERHAFLTDLVPNMMQWNWVDLATGNLLAPAFDKPPELPELSRWMPTDSTKTWDDLTGDEMEPTAVNRTPGTDDSVLVYQYA
jgi:hypothetical protein